MRGDIMISDKIKILLLLKGKKQNELIDCWKANSAQAINNKLRRDSISASDLIRLADMTETQLAFIDQDEKPVIKFDKKDIDKEKS